MSDANGKANEQQNEPLLSSANRATLNFKPVSNEAFSIIGEISTRALSCGSGRRPTRKALEAIGSFIADLLRAAAKDRRSYIYRPMAAGSFSGERFGYHVFKRVVNRLQAAGLLEVVRGYGGGTVTGQATRFRATPSLIKEAQDHGVRLEDLGRHFRSLPRPAAIPEPLVLKASSTMDQGKKEKGKRIAFDPLAPTAATLAKQVNELNAFFAGIEIEPDGAHYAFHRVFNQGDAAGFDWNKGGRLISMGDSYQQMSQGERKNLRLNGEGVVEIDIRASHLTILHARCGMEFDPEADPYAVEGLPREVVKSWVTMTLGYDKFQTRWSKEARGEYARITGKRIGRDYPISQVREAVLKRIPLLSGWPSCDLNWANLQYIESTIIVDSVHHLAISNSIPALPVHDSIIVPLDVAEEAKATLVNMFKSKTGAKPALSVR